MKNSPFEPLFGGNKPIPEKKFEDKSATESFRSMKDIGKRLEKQKKLYKDQKLENQNQKTIPNVNLSGSQQLNGIFDNKKTLLIAILLVVIVVVVAVLIYKQYKQKKAITTIARKLKMLKAG
jgi:hypothetical protein